MKTLFSIPSAFVGGFVDMVLFIIALVVSIIGIVIAYVAHQIVVFMLNFAVSTFELTVNFEVEEGAWAFLIVIVYLMMVLNRLQGKAFSDLF